MSKAKNQLLPLFLFLLISLIHCQPSYTYTDGPSYTSSGIIATLNASSPGSYGINSPYLNQIQVQVIYEKVDEFRIKIIDPNFNRWSIPENQYFPTTKNAGLQGDTQYTVNLLSTGNNGWSFQVIRKSSGKILFDTSQRTFIYSDRYLQIGTATPTGYFYGLGERRRPHFIQYDGEYTIWNKDQAPEYDTGNGCQQLYGSHPVYLMLEDKDQPLYHVVYLRSSNALQYVVSNGGSNLDFKITGGIFDFKFFLGDQYPDTAIRKYHAYINYYTLIPFWAFGFHQCRWGYLNSSIVLEVAQNYSYYDVPLDTMWNDLDYMVNVTTWTVNQNLFKSSDIDAIHNRGQHYVCIFDPEVYYNPSWNLYNLGVQQGAFMKSSEYCTTILNCIWPGLSTWVDYNNPVSMSYWQSLVQAVHSVWPFDGMWTDMNEMSCFYEGECTVGCNCPDYMPQCDSIAEDSDPNKISNDYGSCNFSTSGNFYYQNRVYNSSYIPFTPCSNDPLEDKTLSISATHYTGQDGRMVQGNQLVTDYDFHNFNGYGETIHSYYAQKNGLGITQPFILTRSTVPGSGSYAAHWLGDNASEWEFLLESIFGIFNFQIFGVPFVGADICGFNNNANDELCARWFQTGALYPFSRNHNTYCGVPQEVYAFGPNSSTLAAGRASLKLRYSLMKYYYSLFVRNKGVGTVFVPTWFNFPYSHKLRDAELSSCSYCENNFMIGPHLLVAPVVATNVITVDLFVPINTKWYELDGDSILDNSNNNETIFTVGAPITTHLPIYLLEGGIVHWQDTTDVLMSKNLTNHFDLIIAFQQISNGNYYANGTFLGINDYQNETNLMSKCFSNSSDCNINVVANYTSVSSFNKRILIKYSLATDYSQYEQIYIDQLWIKGIASTTQFVDFTKATSGNPITMGKTYIVQLNSEEENQAKE